MFIQRLRYFGFFVLRGWQVGRTSMFRQVLSYEPRKSFQVAYDRRVVGMLHILRQCGRVELVTSDSSDIQVLTTLRGKPELTCKILYIQYMIKCVNKYVCFQSKLLIRREEESGWGGERMTALGGFLYQK